MTRVQVVIENLQKTELTVGFVFSRIILMEMEAHTDAWPFLEPVNPRLVPGYRKIIKNPMDFLTMRERLLQGGYDRFSHVQIFCQRLITVG